MVFVHLIPKELQALDRLLHEEQITSVKLPSGIYVGLDSMGPVRDSEKDTLFPGAKEALFGFSSTLGKYDLTLVVATNGPDVEGEDILNALDRRIPAKAFAVTQGGGKLIYFDNGGLVYAVMADPNEVELLVRVEENVKTNPLMKAMLEDTAIRTLYDTSIVLTLPNNYETLHRLEKSGIKLEVVIPGINASNYVGEMLRYAANEFTQAIGQLGLGDRISTPLVKAQNKRIYVAGRHLVDGRELSKNGGVTLGSSILRDRGYSAYRLENSIYVADKAADVTGEGQTVIGASERSMISGVAYFMGNVPQGVNVLRRHSIGLNTNYQLVDVGCRLAVNVTMDGSSPRMSIVEGVSMLHISSGLKALEGLTYLYSILHT